MKAVPLILLVLSLAPYARAQGKNFQFEDSLNSASFLSPAHLYLIPERGFKLDLAVKNEISKRRNLAQQSSFIEKNRSTDFKAFTGAAIKFSTLRMGMAVNSGSGSTNFETPRESLLIESREMTISPYVAYSTHHFAFGTNIDLYKSEKSSVTTHENSVSEATSFRIGGLLKNSRFEAGAVYKPEASQTTQIQTVGSDTSKFDSQSRLPMHILLHARLAITMTQNIGVSLSRQYFSEIDSKQSNMDAIGASYERRASSLTSYYINAKYHRPEDQSKQTTVDTLSHSEFTAGINAKIRDRLELGAETVATHGKSTENYNNQRQTLGKDKLAISILGTYRM